MQQRPGFSNFTLTIAILIKLFLSMTVVVFAIVIFLLATNLAVGNLDAMGTPRPTKTKYIKTPMVLFWGKTAVPTAPPSFTNTPETVLISPTSIPTVSPVTEPTPIPPTTIPDVQPTIPADNPQPENVQQATNTANLKDVFLLPQDTFRLDNLAFVKLLGQLGKGRINQVSWAPSDAGKANLITATSGGLYYLDPFTGSEAISVTAKTGFMSVAINPTGTNIVTSSLDGFVTIWKYGSREIVANLDSGGTLITSLTYSPDGSQVYGGAVNGYVFVWNTVDGSLLRQLEGDGNPIRSLQVSPDGQLVVAGSEGKTLTMWIASSGVRFISLTAHYKAINQVAVSPDSKLVATCSDDNTFILWETANGKQVRLTSVQSGVRSLAFTKDGSAIITGEQNGTVTLWNLETGRLNKTIGKVTGEVNSVAFNNDGSLLAIGANTLHVWRPSDDVLAAPFNGFTSSVTSLAFSRDSSVIAAGNQDGRISLWNPKDGSQTAILEGHTEAVTALDFSADGRFLASGSSDNLIIIWDISSGQKVYILRGHSGGVRSVIFNNNGSRLASAGGWVDITVKMWDMTTGSPLYNITGFTKGDIELVLRAGTDMMASAGGDGIIRVWNYESRQLISSIEKHGRAIRSLGFSLDGSRLASSSEDGNTYIWETNGWTLVRGVNSKGSHDLVFSTDNQVLVVGGETIEFFDVSSGNLLTEFQGTPGSQSRLAISSDGKVLAAGSTDGTIRFYGINQ